VHIFLLALFFFFTSFIFSQEIIVSSFDIDNDGWTVSGGLMHYHNSGGNLDGFIEFEDDQDGAGVFIAPNKFLGDLSSYDQGTLSFDLKNTYDNGLDSLWGYGNVKISSSNSSAQKNVVPLMFYSEWTSFTIPLTATDWGLTESGWDSLLAEVTEISIQMDAQWNYYDKSALDNFSINPFSSDVEPDLNDGYPWGFSLSQNFPNPFNPSTKIKYSIPPVGTQHAVSVQIKVFDILGNEIATLMDEEKSVGTYELTWNAANLSSGIYFYQLKATPNGGQAGGYFETKKMILLR
jgi:hypothetical protein